ncbi:hypothetical protein [Agromyces bauzanensis]
MDWTFWLLAAIIVVAAVATHYWYSHRRHAEDVRGRNAEQADAIADVERQRERGRGRSDLLP